MNKKFLSAIMCGAMLTASTSVFVSCEDYGDDIAHLQEQIDQNAATSASELAGKVAALEGQISTLKAAQDNMKDQLAEAKAAAAAAANEAAAAAAKAQATADAAQSGAADAKAAAAAAQAAADAANKGLADAVARVAVLETKVASLEATIAGLTASDKELSAKLNDLQVLANSLKNASDASAEEIKAIKNDIVAKTAELTAQVSKISAEFGAKIDAIDAELNTIKANYATKNELNEKAAELAAVDATLAEQIAANEAYIAAMQEAIAALEAEDAELAALIAENQAAALAEIEAINEELAAQKEAVEAELAAINEKIDEVNGALEQLVMAVMGNKSALEDFQVAVETVVTDMQGQISQLILQANGNYEAIVAIMENLDNLNTAAGDMQGQIESLITQTGANYDDIVKILEALEEQAGWNKDIQTIIVNLQESYLTNDGVLEGMINDLKAVVEGQADQIKALQEWTAAYDAKYEAFKKAQEEAIAAELAKLENVSASLVAAQADIEVLKGQVEALLSSIQSVVFVPQYHDMNSDDFGSVIVPMYNYGVAAWTSEAHNVQLDVEPTLEMKFRVRPAAAAAKLAALYAEDAATVELYVEDALQTRGTETGIAAVKNVVAAEDGVITVTAVFDGEKFANDTYRPTALVIGSKLYDGEEEAADVVLNVTTDYINVKSLAFNASGYELEPNDGVAVNGAGQYEIPYTRINSLTNPLDLSHAEINGRLVNFANWNYNPDLFVYAGIVGSTVYKVSDNTSASTKWSDFVAHADAQGFTFVGQSFKAKSVGGAALVGNVNKTITLRIADKTFGYNSVGTPNVYYDVTYILTRPQAADVYPFGAYSKQWAPTGSTTPGFTVASTGADKFVNGTLDIRTFIIDNITAATEAELATELAKQIDDRNVTYKVNGTAVNYIELTVDASTKKADISVKFPAGTKFEQKNIEVVVATIYGDVKFTATANLSYPNDFLAHEVRFTDGRTGDFIIEAGNQVASYRDGLVGSSLPAAYSNYASYSYVGGVATNVVYTFTQVQNTYLHNNIWYTPDNVNIAPNNYMTLTGVPTAAGNDATNYVKYEVKVTVDGHEVASEKCGVYVKYPLHGMTLTSGVQEIPAATLMNNQTVPVISNVTLNDRYGNKLFENGLPVVDPALAAGIVDNPAVWGITGLTYELSSAVASDGQPVTTVSVSSDGKVGIVDPNISKDITVAVKVSTVNYTYGVVSGIFNVTIKAPQH